MSKKLKRIIKRNHNKIKLNNSKKLIQVISSAENPYKHPTLLSGPSFLFFYFILLIYILLVRFVSRWSGI